MTAAWEQGREAGGYVLAGGRSSRMGTDKALLVRHGTTLIERAARAVSAACGSAVIVGGSGRYDQFGFPVIEDVFPGAGPLAGIHSALLHSVRDWNLIVACDMPALGSAKLRELRCRLPRPNDAPAVLPLHQGRPQPLCGLYSRRALPGIEDALHTGQFKVMAALAGAVLFDWDDEALFGNVNTPEEWQASLAN